MTGTAILNMLFGAALVMFGVLVTAVADRIRSLRLVRDLAPVRRELARAVRAPIEVIEPAPMVSRAEPKARASGTEPKAQMMANDVIAALVAAGYKKAIAAEAAWSCTAGERATVEVWAQAALRRCAQGGAS